MDRNFILKILVVLATVWLPANSLAQSNSLKQQLIGTWTVVSVADVYENGKKVDDWGSEVGGAASFDASGRFTWMIIGRDLENASGSPRVSSRMVIAYYGKYSVDEAAKTITLKAERSTYPNFDGSTRRASLTIKGDTMTQSSTPISTPRGPIVPQIVLKRAE
jgi:lipocalin-like protein